MKNKFKKIFALLLCVCMCICLCGCETWNNFRKAFIDPPQPEKHTIKIGIFEPQTGRQSYDAEDEIAGMELAHEMYPSIIDYDIEFVYEDNRSNPEVCVTAAQTLINKGCAIILGSVSDTLSLAASDVFKEAGCPAISATNTVPILTQTNPFYFRVSYINTFDAEGAAQYATESLKADRIAVFLLKDNDYELGKCEQFEADAIEAIGADTFKVETKVYNEETQEYDSVMVDRPTVKYVYLTGNETSLQINSIFTTLDRDGYYTIFSPSASDLILPFISASRSYEFINNTPEENAGENTDAGETAPAENVLPEEPKSFNWIGTDRWLGIEEKAAAAYPSVSFLKGVTYTIDYDPGAEQSEISKAFLDAYHKKYGEDQTPSDAVALGFDAYLLAVRAIADCDIGNDHESVSQESRDLLLFDKDGVFERDRLTNKLYKVRDLQGVTGTISINENGDPVKDIYIRQFDGRTFNVIYSVRPGLADPEE